MRIPPSSGPTASAAVSADAQIAIAVPCAFSSRKVCRMIPSSGQLRSPDSLHRAGRLEDAEARRKPADE